MAALGSAIVDWSAIWKICLVALFAGAGVVVVFGFLLLGVKFANAPQTDGSQSAAARITGYGLSVVCGAVCIGVVAIGIYAMTQKK